MSLDFAILGFLNYAPMSGYDLKKYFDGSVRHFWYADQSQIYRSLAKLKEKDWVEMEVETQEDRPNRKVYSITASGRDAFQEWLSGSREIKLVGDWESEVPLLSNGFCQVNDSNELSNRE